MKSWSKEEDSKYSHLYANGYPPGNPGQSMYLLKGLPADSCLDLGCGRATISTQFKYYTGVDVSEYIIGENRKKYPDHHFIHASLDDLSGVDGLNFDVAMCCDVMEHIPESEVHSVLTSIAKVGAAQFVFAISTRPSGILDKDGKNLHLTIWDGAKWNREISKYLKVKACDVKGDCVFLRAVKK